MKKKIAVLLGGKSTEHEISLKTGIFIFKTLPRDKYEVKIVPIKKNGDWVIPKYFENQIPEIENDRKADSEKFFSEFETQNKILSNRSIQIENLGCDLVFLGLHGGEGEDGTIQGLLTSYDIPFTGSGILASALAMDKYKSNMLFQQAGLKVARFKELTKEEFYLEKILLDKIDLSYPIFVKPTLGGSSVGVGKAKNISELKERLENLFQTEKKILLQEFVSGKEVSCGVIEKKIEGHFETHALFATEIIPSSEFFDYESKYTIGKSQEITPANISKELMKKIKENALLAHSVLGCEGYSRTDFIIHQETPYILETNTLPGMTATSILPQQANYEGLKMEEILDNLIERALLREKY